MKNPNDAAERKNNMQVCPSCGCEMTMAPDALVQDCASCGHRLLGKQTPPVESLDDLCRGCRHSIQAEHDDLGCHIPDCGCAMSRAAQAADIAILMNAREKINAGGSAQAMWDGASDAQRKKWLRDTGSWASDSGLSWKELMAQGGSQADVMKDYVGDLAKGKKENTNAASREAFEAHTKECAGCLNALESGKLDGMCEAGNKLLMAENAEPKAEKDNALSTCPKCGQKTAEKIVDGRIMQKGNAPPTDLWECSSCESTWMIDTKTGQKLNAEHKNAITPEQAKKAIEWIKAEPLGPAVKSMRFDDGKDYTVQQLEAIARGEKVNSGNCEKCAVAAGGADKLDALPSSQVFTKDHRVHLIKDQNNGLMTGACGAQLQAENDNATADFKVRVDGGSAIALAEFLRVNADLSPEELASVKSLQPGGKVTLGGGAGAEAVVERQNADDKGPFDQPNSLGCNGCDDIKAPLNRFGYCKSCAAQQGPLHNSAPQPVLAHEREAAGASRYGSRA